MGPAEQFQHLLARAVSKYEKLRDVPAHSVHDLSTQYAKAFHAFSQTWEFLQANRRVLVEAGLKRADIGEIAAKIGHLHFNWYLRCADTRFLVESYIFYEAIHARQYYQEHDLLHDTCLSLCGAPSAPHQAPVPAGTTTPAAAAAGVVDSGAASQLAGTLSALSSAGSDTLGSPASSVAEQQLRYYARFILVCIMLGNKEEAVNLLQEFQALVAAYSMSRGVGSAAKDAGTTHHSEWQLVLAEVVALLTADPGMPLPRSPGAALTFRPCCRANPTSMEVQVLPHTPRIHHAVLVGYHHRQVKLAELSVDVLRMMQALEWHDERLAASEALVGLADSQHASSSPGMHMTLGATQVHAQAAGIKSAAAHQQAAAVPALGSIMQHAPLSSIPERGSPAGTTPEAGSTPEQSHQAPSPAAMKQGAQHSSLDDDNTISSAQDQVSAAPAVAQPAGLPPLPPQHVHQPSNNQQQQQQQQPPAYVNPPRTLLYRTTAPAVLCALHGAAASLPADARRVLFLYLSAGSIRSRMSAAASHSGATPLHMQGGRLLPAPVARLPAVPSTSCLTSSLAAAAASNASLKDANGVDLGGAWCLSPPPTQKPAGELGRSGNTATSAASFGALTACALRVEELRPLTRHRLMVVADGDVACELRSLVGSELAYPLLALMSPRHRPSAFGDAARTGQLLTLFLTLPISAFCLIMGEQDPPPHTLHALQDAVEESLGCIASALHQALTPPQTSMWPASLQTPGSTSVPTQPHPIANAHASSNSLLGSPLVSLLAQATAGQGHSTPSHNNNGSTNNSTSAWLQNPQLQSHSGSTISDVGVAAGGNSAAAGQGAGSMPWALPFQDVLLRQLICRFVLARAALAYHRASTGRPECQAECVPELPLQVSPSSAVCVEAVLRIAAVLRRQALFEGHVSVCAAAAAAAAAGPMSQPAPAPCFHSVSTAYLPTPQGSAGPGTAEGGSLLTTQLQGTYSSTASLSTSELAMAAAAAAGHTATSFAAGAATPPPASA